MHFSLHYILTQTNFNTKINSICSTDSYLLIESFTEKDNAFGQVVHLSTIPLSKLIFIKTKILTTEDKLIISLIKFIYNLELTTFRYINTNFQIICSFSLNLMKPYNF